MLQPKNEKYRKKFRGKRRGFATRGNALTVGEFGLKSTSRNWVTSQQLEAARKAIVRYTKRKGKLWIRVFPDKSFTLKPAEVKMGGGKGEIDGYVAVIKPGRILFELSGVTSEVAREGLKRAGDKLAVRTKFVEKYNG